MSTTVCLLANALNYPVGGGHLWVYLNWALGLRALDCAVTWLEEVDPGVPAHELQANVAALEAHLERYGLGECVALCSSTGAPLPQAAAEGSLDLDAAAEADLLLNMRYGARPEVVVRFRRTALVDIDPGLLQTWVSAGQLSVAHHDAYFTTGETVGQPGARFPDAGLEWQYTPPCVALSWWPPCRAAADAPFTTISHWYMDEWEQAGGELYNNDKRSGFLPFLGLPRRTSEPLELALCLAGNNEERAALEERGWRVREAWEVTSTPWD